MAPEINNTTTTKKRVLIQLRTTEEDKKTLTDLAKEAGMNMTDFIKSRVFEYAPKTRVATFDREILIKLLAELGRVGSNVNQIAKVMNTEKKTFYTVSVREDIIRGVLATVQTVTSNIYKQINYGVTGQTEGERQPVGELPSEEGG